MIEKRTWVLERQASYSVAGEGMPVLFLHGWALGHHTYRSVIEAVAAKGVKVIAPTLPGFGRTEALPKSEFSLAGYAKWVDALCEAIGLDESAVVLGHSFGGGVAVRFAHDYRSRVRSLVLVNSIGGSAWQRGRTMRSISERPLWDWGLHFPSDVWPVRQATRVIPVIAEDLIPNLVRNPRSIMRVAGLARRADLRYELEHLRDSGMPVTILWAARDGVIPRESFEALCVAAGVEGTVVEGSHSWLLADPDQFGEVITNDVNVARMAREMEQATPTPAPESKKGKRAAKKKGLSRVSTLRDRGQPDEAVPDA